MSAKKAGKTRRGKKGAIELSLGFIITVVFAVVLLSLAIFWIRGFFTGLEPLTVDLRNQAQSEISKVFQTTDKKLAVWPDKQKVSPNTNLIMSAGIRNNDKEGRNLYFVLNMKATSTDTSMDLSQINKWVLVPSDATRADASTTATSDITLRIPSDVPQGNYMFKVYACYGTTASETGDPKDCDINSGNPWGSPVPVTISISA